MRDHADPRALAFAVAASLGLHAALLALRASEPPPPSASGPTPMLARLVEPEVTTPAEVLKPRPRPPKRIVVPTPPPAPEAPTSIAQYRAQFIVAAVRYKREPLPGLAGEVVLRLEMTATGELAGVTVTRSSGEAALDEQALEMFRLAAPQVPLPPGLRGRPFGFDVRAVYSQTD